MWKKKLLGSRWNDASSRRLMEEHGTVVNGQSNLWTCTMGGAGIVYGCEGGVELEETYQRERERERSMIDSHRVTDT